MEPAETRAHHGLCPECGKPLTVGVQHRVSELADRPIGHKPATAGEFLSIVPLPEIMGEILGVGPKSKAVMSAVDDLVRTLGPELAILLELPIDELHRAKSPLLVEAITRLRDGQVIRDAGYDGEYSTISHCSRPVNSTRRWLVCSTWHRPHRHRRPNAVHVRPNRHHLPNRRPRHPPKLASIRISVPRH
jgi:PHP family Zn ribbon phosphoesterase